LSDGRGFSLFFFFFTLETDNTVSFPLSFLVFLFLPRACVSENVVPHIDLFGAAPPLQTCLLPPFVPLCDFSRAMADKRT